MGKDKMDAQEQSELPAWLESLRAFERPNAPAGGQQNFSTADLIDENALPGWMRTEQTKDISEGDSNRHPAIRPASMSAPDTDSGAMHPGGFSAHDLIDPASLPSWMHTNQQSSYPAAPAVSMGANDVRIYPQGTMPQQTPARSPYSETPPPLLSAGDLIDQQSLPGWMAGQASQSDQQLNQATWQGGPASHIPAGREDNEQQSGLAASSLLDMNALPAWLRENKQAQIYGNPARQQEQSTSNGLAAGSLIDMNALPAWLRSADSQPQGTTGGNMPPTLYGAPGHIESARVPSRPRAEMVPQEQSEVAANVFSSMLGVASTAPYYPPPTPDGQQNFQNAPAQAMPSMSLPPPYNSNQGVPSAPFNAFPAQGMTPAAGYPANQNTQIPYAA
ncbi:MAG TPA: hypothetical protein VKR83_17445, partial [Ktedonobacteraceae bacterium]|nr:hypothetical protein [Ktedonobacteraceae bacterium]